jgi:hypothetical protein
MPKPKKKSLQEIIDEMRDLQAQEDDLIQEIENGIGSLISDDLNFIQEDEEN